MKIIISSQYAKALLLTTRTLLVLICHDALTRGLGRAAVDIEFPGKEKGVPRSDRKEDYHVLDSGGTVYDTMLNQTVS